MGEKTLATVDEAIEHTMKKNGIKIPKRKVHEAMKLTRSTIDSWNNWFF